MDLDLIKEQTKKMIENINYLIKQYQSIAQSLTNQYRIMANKDAQTEKMLQDLIVRYNRMIDVLSRDYIGSMNHILNYIENSKRNIDKLTQSFTNTLSNYNETVFQMDTTE